MKTLTINGKKRGDLGKSASRLLRKEDQVPCVIYGGEKTYYFSSEEKNFKELVYTPNSYITNVQLDDEKIEAVMQDIQFHPVTDKILHIDFIEVRDGKPVIVELPIITKGKSVGVMQGGILVKRLRKLPVKGFVNNLPESIEIDISDLNIGDSVSVGDLSMGQNEILSSKKNIVVKIKTSRVANTAKKAAEADKKSKSKSK
ncbi:50S ribosomal protein L25/general stress protein Ctc [Ichthyobacterium seriolicida]|uniref:Large ribosomal subunit protein bL25 n=1 Tax=Ichthyobacterium seriolicida TaxID=242600 RepID=A0A1J1EAN8_9FLAO|nr:50S ribosomal protein L25/general stress protein Ctc [Ichthyobacterium seriolicida]BAV95003.1 50S ribosomal protein L25 [Ichthyobacterium seriolicida]